MTDSDKGRFGTIMQGLAENFGVQLSTAGVALRFEALKRCALEDINKASLRMLGSRKFTTMPTVADFLENIMGGSADDKGLVESGKVWRAIRERGAYQNVVFDDPVTQAVIVDIYGGWQKLCREMVESEQKWFVKEFAKAYGAFHRQGVKHFGSLPGIYGEITFTIGDKKKALAVLTTLNETEDGIVDLKRIGAPA
jgi:hypothetical protein